VSQRALPNDAEPPWTALILVLAIRKNATSKMKAMKATVAAKPDMQVLKHVMDISRTWASRPNIADIPERPRATICRTKAYVSHLMRA